MSEEDTDGGDGGLDITLGKIVAYPVGALLILSGLGGLITNVVSGILILTAGVLSLPIVRSRLKNSQGITLSRWATVAIVLVLVVAGGALLPSDAGSSNGGGDVQMINQSSDDLVPTIDDFETGWTVGTEGNNTASYINTESDSTIRYEVTVYDSVESAEDALEESRPDNTATESVSVGDEGFKSVQSGNHRIWFRTANAVCFTGYNPGVAVFTEDSNSIDHAERCQEAMTD